MARVELDKIPEACRLTVPRAAELDGISRREGFNRVTPGDAHEYTWAWAPNVPPYGSGKGPKQIKIVDGRSLTPGPGEGRDRFLRGLATERMRESEFFGLPGSSFPGIAGARSTPVPNGGPTTPPIPQATPESAAASSGIGAAANAGPLSGAFLEPAIENRKSKIDSKQGDLFLGELADRLPGAYEQKRVAERRLKLIEPVANGKYRYLGFETKGDYLKSVASEHKVSVRSLQRWWDTYRAHGQGVRGLQALMDDQCGPAATGPNLEPWMKLYLETERLVNRSTREAAYQNLLQEVGTRQAAHGPAHIYQQPTQSAVYRYWASLGAGVAEAALEGRSAVKAAAMQISRTYADVHSLDRVGVDEWIADVMSYDPNQLLYPKTSKTKPGQVRLMRSYIVTMLDERSIFPLHAVTCEAPDVEKEIELLTAVCLQYGVPGLINSDRGRFRGKIYSGKFLEKNRAPINSTIDGILDQLGIGRNLPREHNPQGNRLERFHREMARFARTLPGWVGADTVERQEKSDVDEQIRQHEDWVRGKRPQELGTPLLTHDEVLERFLGFFERWREEHQSEGTDMNHLTPRAVFEREKPVGGFRQVSAEQLDQVTAAVYPDRLVQPGGTIEIPEGNYKVTRYYSHELVLIQGQRRTVTRSRTRRGYITVHGTRPDEAAILAPAMPKVGTSDPDHLSLAIAEKTFSRQLVEAALPGRNSKIETRNSAPRSRDRINPDELAPLSEISSSEWAMRYERRQPVTSEEIAARALEMELAGVDADA